MAKWPKEADVTNLLYQYTSNFRVLSIVTYIIKYDSTYHLQHRDRNHYNVSHFIGLSGICFQQVEQEQR